MVPHLTQEETAKRLNISARTLEGWRQSGEVFLPYLKLGSAVRYRVVDIEEFEARQRHEHVGRLAPYAGREDVA